MRRIRYRSGVAEALHGAGLPYGYTLVVWSTGEVLTSANRLPTLLEIALYVAGALSAYGLLRLATLRAGTEAGTQLASTGHALRSGAIQAVGIGLAILAAWLAGQLRGPWAWPLGSFCATLVYFLAVAVEMGMEEHEARQEQPQRQPDERRRKPLEA